MRDDEEICRVKNNGEIGLIPQTRQFLKDAETRRAMGTPEYLTTARQAWLNKMARRT